MLISNNEKVFVGVDGCKAGLLVIALMGLGI
jgi:predicted RNase H-like nuclease